MNTSQNGGEHKAGAPLRHTHPYDGLDHEDCTACIRTALMENRFLHIEVPEPSLLQTIWDATKKVLAFLMVATLAYQLAYGAYVTLRDVIGG